MNPVISLSASSFVAVNEVGAVAADGGFWWHGVPIHWCAIAALVLHLINFGVALAERSRP